MRIRGIVRTATLEENPPGSDQIEMVLRAQGVGPDQPRTFVVPYALLLADPDIDPDAIQGKRFEAEVDEAEPGPLDRRRDRVRFRAIPPQTGRLLAYVWDVHRLDIRNKPNGVCEVRLTPRSVCIWGTRLQVVFTLETIFSDSSAAAKCDLNEGGDSDVSPRRPFDPSRHAHGCASDQRPVASCSSWSVNMSAVPPRLAEQFGRYRIIKRLGQGGMGSVYLAQDTHLERPVALKVPDFGDHEGPEARRRFLEEARTAATLDHPYLCPVYDAGEIEGQPYLTMAYIEGQSLAAAIGDEGWPQRQVAALVGKLALALQEAHTPKVVHRDLKPANVMIKRPARGASR